MVDIESAILSNSQAVLTTVVFPYFESQPFLYFMNNNSWDQVLSFGSGSKQSGRGITYFLKEITILQQFHLCI